MATATVRKTPAKPRTKLFRLVVERVDSHRPDPDQHRLRAQLLHSLVTVLDIPVENWGNTDSEQPHEVVEIIVALGGAGVFTAMVAIFKTWINRNKIARVELRHGNQRIDLGGATAEDVVQIIKAMKLEADVAARKPARRRAG